VKIPTILAVSALSLMPAFADSPAPLEDFRFRVEKLAGGMPQPMELEVAPDGRIFFNEYTGSLKLLDPKTKQIVEVGKLKVFTGQENGFLGFALDPKFAENGHIFCLYSPEGFDGQYLSRFTIKNDVLDLASEKMLLKYEEQRKECCHHAGTVEFGPDGNLYWSAGDNTHPHGDSEGYAPIDERDGKSPWDAQKSAANTMSLAGKINRIRPLTDGTYEIPPGNLFPPGTPKTRPEIYAMGCRNPWRMSIDQKTGYVYWGEVGPDAGGDGKRGPRGYDEINQAKKAGNHGWPYFIANNRAYFDYDYTAKTVGPQFDPAHPINEGPNNTGLRELPPAVPAFIYWPYGASPEFPQLPNAGGRTACAGPVYYCGIDVAKTNGFPQHFSRCLLFWDWERPFIKWARLDKDSNLAGIEDFTDAIVVANKADQIERAKAKVAAGATLVKRPIDATFDAGGALYILDYGETWGANKDSQLLKITYLRGNLPPIAKATVNIPAGREPLAVEFSAEGSRDPEGRELKYAWNIGGKHLASGPKHAITLTEPGNYTATLTVTDADGATATASVPVSVGNSTPVVKFQQPQDGDFFTPGGKIPYRITVDDTEDGPSTAKPDEFATRTLLTTTYLRADGKDAAIDAGLSLMKQSDCFNCHAPDTQLIGPALLAIADKYRGQPAAADTLNKKVREGGNGVWGQIPMLPHPQHTTDEVAIMLRWLLALEKGKGAPTLQRGLTGELTAPTPDKPGTLIIEATYTDTGRTPALPLTGQTTIALRSRRVEAETGKWDGNRPQILNLGGASSGKGIGDTAHGHTIRYQALNLADSKTVTIRYSSGGVGGKIELHTGSPTGDLLATLEVPNTGAWDAWKETTVPLAKTPARGDIYLLFINPGKSGLMNIDWLQFNP
jgi:cytochrome c